MEHGTSDFDAQHTHPPAESSRPAASLEQGPDDPRMADIVERATAILERWTATGERQERAVEQFETQLSELEIANARLQRDTSQKMRDLERVVQSEWTALRHVHEEPVRQLQEQANNLTEVCIATAHTARRGFDQAEARLTAIEHDLQQQITELRREMQAVVGELRLAPVAARPALQPSAWPLEGVARLHQQLRETVESPDGVQLLDEGVAGARGTDGVGAQAAIDVRAHHAHGSGTSLVDAFVSEVPESIVEVSTGGEPSLSPSAGVLTVDVVPRDEDVPAPAPVVSTPAIVGVAGTTAAASAEPELVERLRALERTLHAREVESRDIAERARRSLSLSRVAVLAMAAVVLVAIGFALWSPGRPNPQSAQTPPEASVDGTAGDTASIRDQAAREIAAARALAAQAQAVTAVLAAPDLVRFNLIARGDTSTGSAQALWSRTRGFVLSGTGLSPVPEGKTYQVWLLARGQTINAGTFEPDASGSVTLAVPPPPTTLPVFSVVVSLEPSGGSARPDGPPVLVRTRLQS